MANKLSPQTPQTQSPLSDTPLSKQDLEKIDAYWRAANYLSVGQIYLMDNPLLQEPLKLEHIKKRLLGHWGTTPGLNFIYTHLNRVIKNHDLNMIFMAGPGMADLQLSPKPILKEPTAKSTRMSRKMKKA